MPCDPLILGFDTSAAHCAAALLCGGRIVAERFEEMGRGQAERLMPLMEEVLAEGGFTWAELTAIGVGIGPGNFTGIRISVAAARGLALGLGIPAIGVSSLEAQAFGHPRPLLSVVDARRGYVYAQRLGRDGDGPAELHRADEIEAAADRVRVGPGISASPAPAIARIAAARLAAGAPLPRPAPLYVRPADAAPSRDAPVVILP